MSRLVAVALALACGGCFSSWALTQAAGTQRILDEHAREERVPMPDVRERLRVAMPLAPQLAAAPYQPASTTPTAPPVAQDPLPFALECTSTQSANDTVYRSAFRYGKTWKKVTAAMFLVEAGLAALYYFGSDLDKPENQLATGFFAVDALGTAALAFAPRKEIYKTEVQPVVSTIRTDCPAGLVLEIASESFPVDAAGHIGELGEAALDAWMSVPSTPIRVAYQDRVRDLQLGQNEVCTWHRTRRHPEQSTCPAYWSSSPRVEASLEVPMGTLTLAE